MRSNSYFHRGSGMYKCTLCGRNTRQTGDQGGIDMCPDCYAICGIDNHCNDNRVTLAASGYLGQVNRRLANIAKRGGNVDAVKAACGFAFAK